MCVQDAVDPANPLAQCLLPEIWCRIDQNGIAVILNHDRRPQSRVARVAGVANFAVAPQRRHAHTRAGPEYRNDKRGHYASVTLGLSSASVACTYRKRSSVTL